MLRTARPLTFAVLSALTALALSPPLQAQEPQSAREKSAAEGGDTIVVERGRPSDVTRGEVTSQARDIARESGNHREIPLARFEDRLCPGIAGLREEHAAIMIDRIRANARDLDIRIMPDGCAPNLVIVFSDDSERTLRNLMENNPQNFQYINPQDRAEMRAPAPVHVWTNIEPRTRDGMPIPQVRDLTSPPVTRQWMAHSKLYTSTRRDITSAMVIFDTDEVENMTLLQLADYATMRGLVQARPVDDPAMDSILTLFETEGPHPERLTDFDRAYLQAVYDWLPNLPALMKLANVNRELNRLTSDEDD